MSHEVIVQLIAATTNSKGLVVHAELDEAPYAAGIKISDKEMKELNLHPHTFHGEWNYEIHPRRGPLN